MYVYDGVLREGGKQIGMVKKILRKQSGKHHELPVEEGRQLFLYLCLI